MFSHIDVMLCLSLAQVTKNWRKLYD